MMRTEYCALHEAEPAFGSVDVRKAGHAHIFVSRMVDRRVTGKVLANSDVGSEFVSHQMRLAADDFVDCFLERLGFDVRDMEGTAFTIAVNKRDHDMLLR